MSSTAGTPEGVNEGPQRPARVLVVDDTSQIRMLIRVNLELEGHLVDEASDGASCLARLRDTSRAPVEVVVLDAEMGPVDGWAATAEIRRDPALAHLPVLMVTASVQAHHRARALAVGIDAFISKPFEPEEVVETVERLARGAPRRDPEASRARPHQPDSTRPTAPARLHVPGRTSPAPRVGGARRDSLPCPGDPR